MQVRFHHFRPKPSKVKLAISRMGSYLGIMRILLVGNIPLRKIPSIASTKRTLSENRFSTPCGISPTVIMTKKEEKGIRKKDKSKDRLSRAGGCCNDVDANELDALGVIPWNYADFVGWKHSLAENS